MEKKVGKEQEKNVPVGVPAVPILSRRKSVPSLNEIKMNMSIFIISYLGYWYQMFFNNCNLFPVQITNMLSHYLVVEYDNKQHLLSVELDYYYYYYQQHDYYG